eukprot:403351269
MAHQRANRTPVPLDTPGFEVLTEHQSGSPMHPFYQQITLYTTLTNNQLIKNQVLYELWIY